jgi:hypothetical protein
MNVGMICVGKSQQSINQQELMLSFQDKLPGE